MGQKKYNVEKLLFSEDFFKGEVREGFFVEEMMKRAWAAQLEVLYVFDEICQRNDITYFADWGTLLGAVRHKGFIPWDDDIDIVMKRADYDRFIEIAKRELPKGFQVIGPQTDYGYELGTLVTNAMGYENGCEDIKQFHDFPYPAGIDIYPLDGLPDDYDERLAIEDVYAIMAALCKKDAENEADYQDNITKIECLLNIVIDRNVNTRLQIRRLADQLAGLYSFEECQKVAAYAYYVGDKRFIYDREWYSEVIYVPFENMMLPIPKNYDEILTVMYGDYMVPVKDEGRSHDYPYYKKYMKTFNDEQMK